MLYQSWQHGCLAGGFSQITSSGITYTITFSDSRLSQKNESTGTVREIRRHTEATFQRRQPLAVAQRVAALEQEFKPWGRELATSLRVLRGPSTADPRRVPLSSSSPEYVFLEGVFVGSMVQHRVHSRSSTFCEAPKVEVLRVDRVIAKRLQNQYLDRVEEISVRMPRGATAIPCIRAERIIETAANEYLLFHGAKSDSITAILKNGFDPRRAGEAAGQMFGMGCYFAENASKSDFYCADQLELEMLVVQVCLGEAHVAKAATSFVRPPDKSGTLTPYDSVVGEIRDREGCLDHREYIVYERSQALPTYIIVYKHVARCICRRCVWNAAGVHARSGARWPTAERTAEEQRLYILDHHFAEVVEDMQSAVP